MKAKVNNPNTRSGKLKMPFSSVKRYQGGVKKFAVGGSPTKSYAEFRSANKPGENDVPEALEEFTPSAKRMSVDTEPKKSELSQADIDKMSYSQAFKHFRDKGKGTKFTWRGSKQAAYREGEQPWSAKSTKAESKPAPARASAPASAPSTASRRTVRGPTGAQRYGTPESRNAPIKDNRRVGPLGARIDARVARDPLASGRVEQSAPEAVLFGGAGALRGLAGLMRGVGPKSGEYLARTASNAPRIGRVGRTVEGGVNRTAGATRSLPAPSMPAPQARISAPSSTRTSPAAPGRLSAPSRTPTSSQQLDAIRFTGDTVPKAFSNSVRNSTSGTGRSAMRPNKPEKKFAKGGGVESKGKTRGRFV